MVAPDLGTTGPDLAMALDGGGPRSSHRWVCSSLRGTRPYFSLVFVTSHRRCTSRPPWCMSAPIITAGLVLVTGHQWCKSGLPWCISAPMLVTMLHLSFSLHGVCACRWRGRSRCRTSPATVDAWTSPPLRLCTSSSPITFSLSPCRPLDVHVVIDTTTIGGVRDHRRPP